MLAGNRNKDSTKIKKASKSQMIKEGRIINENELGSVSHDQTGAKRYWDDMSGKELKADPVEAARAEEIATVKKMNVWVKVDRDQCMRETGRPPIKLRWVDVNKGDNMKPNYRSRIVAKGISAGRSTQCYRGLVDMGLSSKGSRNHSQCDSMLIGDCAHANTYPYIQVREPSSVVEHEASTSKIGEDQLFYFQQRGISPEDAVGAIISGFCREVFNELPLEFASEVNQLMSLKLEGSVG